MNAPVSRDDAAILDSAILLRAIHHTHVFYDEERGRCRPTSAAFKSKDDLSVVIHDDLAALGKDLRDVEAHPVFDGKGIATVSAKTVRSNGLGVERDKVPDEHAPPAHGTITGKTSSKAREHLATSSNWMKKPPQDKDGHKC